MNDQSENSSAWKNPSPDEIKNILKDTKTIAVVGLSSKPERASNGVARYLIEQGFEVIPVNPVESEILGKKSYPDLGSIGQPVDLVDIFRKGEATPPIIKDALAIRARCIWLQEGVISQESYNLAQEAGVPIIMDKCVLKEHQR